MKLPSVLNEERKGELRDLAMENSINCFVASMEDYSDADLVELFEACTSSGCIAQVHAESAEFVKRNAKKLLNQGLTGPEGYALAHAEEAEEEATLRASALANQLNCPLYLSHVSTSATTEIVCNKRNKGHVVCGEVHPTALALDGRGYWDQDWKKAATLVTSPPIRKEQNEALIAKLSDSESGIDIVGSNHAAFNLKQKALGLKDFTKIPVGTNGVQERMSIVWDKCVAENGPMSPERFVAVTSANAAKTFGLYPDKGYIEVGSQADIVIWNPEVVTQIDVEDQISKSDMNAFQGMTFKGQAETVILRGRVIMFENELKAVQGHGRYLPLSPYPVHIYDKIKSRQVFNFHPVERKEEEINGDIPPPEKAISFQPEKAASLHISNIDLKLHPNDEEELDRTSPVVLTRTNKHRSSIRIKNPPGFSFLFTWLPILQFWSFFFRWPEFSRKFLVKFKFLIHICYQIEIYAHNLIMCLLIVQKRPILEWIEMMQLMPFNKIRYQSFKICNPDLETLRSVINTIDCPFCIKTANHATSV